MEPQDPQGITEKYLKNFSDTLLEHVHDEVISAKEEILQRITDIEETLEIFARETMRKNEK